MSRVYLLSSAPDAPTGGVRTIYRVCSVLREAGVDAWVFHPRDPVGLTWLGRESDRPPIVVGHAEVRAHDLVVVPDVWAWRLADETRALRRVVFNQGAYISFRAAPFPPSWDATPYEAPNTEMVLVVSADNESYLRHAFPAARIKRVHLAIDGDLYRPEDKDRVIAAMPRKRFADQQQVGGILYNRGVLDRWPLRLIDGQEVTRAAELLRTAQIYLSFTHEIGEGFPLPVAEALACGCVVVGYTGQGACEVLREDTGYPIPAGDITAFSGTVEGVIGQLESDPAPVLARAAAGSELVRSTYTREREADDVLAAFDGLVSDHRGRRVDTLDIRWLGPTSRVKKGLALVRDGARLLISRG